MTKNKTNVKTFAWMRFWRLYALISGLLIFFSIYSLASWQLLIGLEFRGGVEITYQSSPGLDIGLIEQKLIEKELEISTLQSSGEDGYIVKAIKISPEDREKINDIFIEIDVNSSEVKYQVVGPSVGDELVKKTMIAILISAGSILLWVAYQFKSIKFGIAAIFAMAHDSFILVGSFSILGFLYGAEVDFLFVTAVLTTLSFSVHDTIVVFDRIREISKKHGGEFTDMANRAVNETMRRSVINSLTIIFMLLALVILGGVSIRWFATALLIGAVLGTYSSPFVAVPLLVLFNKINLKKK